MKKIMILAAMFITACGGESMVQQEPVESKPVAEVAPVVAEPVPAPAPDPVVTPEPKPVEAAPVPEAPLPIAPLPMAPEPQPAPVAVKPTCYQMVARTDRLEQLAIAYQSFGYVYLYGDGSNLGKADAYGLAIVHSLGGNVWAKGICPHGTRVVDVDPYPPIHDNGSENQQ